MSTAVDFHSQIASIMEVLANAAVAEICKVVDDGYAVVHLEMSRSQKENEFLRRKIKLLELQIARYRAERVKGMEGSISSRFPGVRLLNRHSKDSLAGQLLQGKTRFQNRDPRVQQSVQKRRSGVDCDPDQDVVTTTKTESAEPEDERELLIVKVEGALEPGSSNNKTLGQGHLDVTSSPQSKGEKMEEAEGDTPENACASQSLLDWQESSETEEMGQPSCSTYTLETVASFSKTRINSVCGFRTISRRPQGDMDQASPASTYDISVINSQPNAAEDNCTGELLPGQGGGDRADEMTSLSSVRPGYQPLLCIQIGKPPNEMMFEGNHISAFTKSPVARGTVDSQQQETQHSWSRVGQMDRVHFSSQSHLYQASSSQKQESGPVQSQQQQHSSLPYACTFCSRRYAHQCQLRIHERVHTGEKPYQCIQCGKSFGQFCSLKRHQMVHTGERPFPCPHCGKQFSTSTNLKVHQSVHTGEKRFQCSKCGKNFSFLSNLIRHQALHNTR
uniref:zinc finger protein 8-like isoform X2 n=1 Tax=Monopterus albus TaxID=43700 RepID=UPI0009B43FD5|nr:zinc finger protein 8-like isoform X2 [Monopterus albus]